MNQATRKCAQFATLAAAVLLYAQAASAAPPRIYATIEGQQGKFLGNSPIDGRQDKTEVLKFAYSVSIPMAGDGMARGTARQHGPVRITKVVGPASPQLFRALVSNETLQRVVIDFLEVNEEGMEYLGTSIRLTNAKVLGIEHATEEGAAGAKADARNLETVSFVFQSIEVVNPQLGLTATDSLQVR